MGNCPCCAKNNREPINNFEGSSYDKGEDKQLVP